MALFDFLKRKKEVQKAKESFEKIQDKKQPEKKADKVSVEKEIKKEPILFKNSSATKKSFSYNIIREPHISEKATYLAEKNKYVFKVYDNANKPEIKKSVEGIYGVDVLDVNIIKIPSKKRRMGKTQGFKKGHTKALVTIKEGQKIEIL